jgi:4-carboxymuconolactone decarboxylase
MSTTPRVEPLRDDQMTDEQLDLVKHYRRDGQLPNVFRVALRNTKLFKAYKSFGLYTMALSSVPARLRELAILRIGYLNKSDYEWGHHVRISQDIGLSNADIARVKLGADAPGWTALEAAAIRLVDQMKYDANLDDATYAILLDEMGEDALVELINTVGNYAMVSTLLNILRVPLEPGVVSIDTQLD